MALGLIGTMAANRVVAARLHDDSADVRKLAVDTLWSLWFRADSEANNRELQKLMRMRDREKALSGLDELILRASAYAEAYNQRTILLFRMKDFERQRIRLRKGIAAEPGSFRRSCGNGPILSANA